MYSAHLCPRHGKGNGRGKHGQCHAVCPRPVPRSARSPRVGFRWSRRRSIERPVQSFLGVIPIENLRGLGEQFPGGVPDPSRSIAQRHATGGLREVSPGGFAQYALGGQFRGRMIPGVGIQPLFQRSRGQPQSLPSCRHFQLRSPDPGRLDGLRAFRFPGGFRPGGSLGAPFFSLLRGGGHIRQLTVGPCLARLPIGVHSGPEFPAGIHLLPGKMSLFRS